ncbi:hypothetical protein EDC94DRAFT_666052 [Helicostylum pulchrum]|nr:hypothetical protein EDC94DRAFT_666052 [Helicostylum pulchrum]
MSTSSNNLSTSPLSTGPVTKDVGQEDIIVPSDAPVATNVSAVPVSAMLNDLNNEQLLFESENLDSVLSDEIPIIDMEMDDVSVFAAVNSYPHADGTPVQGIDRNVIILQQRIYELSSIIIQSGNVVPPHLVTELRSLRASICELMEVQRILKPAPAVPQTSSSFSYKPSSRPPTVPTQLPFFQWMGHVYDDTRTVFPSLNACVSKFEDVLNTYQLEFNDHWCRLLPLCLPIEIRAWLADFTKDSSNATWNDSKAAINLQYGITQDAEQEVATTDLLDLQMSNNQTIESFMIYLLIY